MRHQRLVILCPFGSTHLIVVFTCISLMLVILNIFLCAYRPFVYPFWRNTFEFLPKPVF
jgi:hypothetical protein